jgi:3-oxoacyl-[acyl-carrier protein] reductase
MELGLNGRNALVTGGTRGLGRAIVRALAAAGANVVTCHRREGEAADSLVRELKEHGGDHHVVRADVTRPEAVDQLVDECRERLGSLDLLVNNVGVTSHVPLPELALEEWRRVLDVNLTAAYLVTQRAAPLLRDGASIVNVGAAVALRGLPLRSHYTAAKAGLLGLTRSLCKELGPRGIRVNLLAPGIMATEEAANLPPEQHQRYRSLIALGELGRPEDVAGVVLFLASDLSSYVTGATVTADGGI